MKTLYFIIISFFPYFTFAQTQMARSLGADIQANNTISNTVIIGEAVIGNMLDDPIFYGSNFGFLGVASVNLARPVADAGQDIEVTEGTNITLDGSASFDPNDDPLTYQWISLDGGILSNPTAPQVSFPTPDVVAIKKYRFVLIVSDATLSSEPDTVTVTVRDTEWEVMTYPILTSTLYATVTINGQNAEECDAVRAYIDGECRAVGEIFFYQGLAYTTLNLYVTEASTVSFQVYDSSEDYVCEVDGTLAVNGNGNVNTPFDPHPIEAACGCVARDRAALIALYDATDGANWTSAWDLSQPMSTWSGVVLNPEGCIQELNLSNRQLNGTIVASLSELDNLIRLDLSLNQLTGTIPPELGLLSNLIHLNLGINELMGTIPTELANLNNLTLLYLNNNELSGTIPAELGQLSNLNHLLLDDNQLSGTIPTELGQLANLTYCYLHQNQLSGDIPIALTNLNNLTRLYLYENQLSGVIPAELGQLNNLNHLFLYNNQLNGTIPVELGQLSNLTLLFLHENELSGDIPLELANLNNLTQIYLHNNQLSGCFPTELNTFCNIDYNFTGNPELPGGGDFAAFCNNGVGECLIGVSISGYIHTENGTPMTGGNTILLQNGNIYIEASNITGFFEHRGLMTALDYFLLINNASNSSNGVNTTDIDLVQAHVLEITSLTSPYKIIAADVNNSTSVTIGDVILMRAVDDGSMINFPDVPSWRFVRSDFNFTNINHPFPFPENITYYNLSESFNNQSFIGIKMGDVNESADPQQ